MPAGPQTLYHVATQMQITGADLGSDYDDRRHRKQPPGIVLATFRDPEIPKTHPENPEIPKTHPED